ncbi:MAG: hypothetical protein L0312_11965 [Acidobacteria bacterium]|nr:hypothetical protein [Acidobacteriota bacterium]
MTSVLGQLILGTDKRNPLFTVYAEEGEEQLHVYYGLELLEVVSADRNDPNFKMLVGRLYNCGLNLVVLQRTFAVDPKTIQRWGGALRSRDAHHLLRVLAGRRGGRKLTPEIEAYVRVRWPDLSRRGTYGLGKRLRQEIESIFHVKISQETLRPLRGKLKRGEGLSGERTSDQAVETTASGLPESSQGGLEGQEVSSTAREMSCGCAPEGSEPKSGLACPALRLEAAPQSHWCDHAGVLVFAPMLLAIAQVLDPPEALFKQWLASLLLGALNIEQTKFLNWEDMSRLLGSVVRFPHPQRQELERVATEASFLALARFNARQIGADTQALHRRAERAGRMVSGDPVGGQSDAQRFHSHRGGTAALLRNDRQLCRSARALFRGGGTVPKSLGVSCGAGAELGRGPGDFWEGSLRESPGRSHDALDHVGKGLPSAELAAGGWSQRFDGHRAGAQQSRRCSFLSSAIWGPALVQG